MTDTTAQPERTAAQKEEIRRLGRMLRGLAKTARDASFTGQLAGGKGVAVHQYNAILSRLHDMGVAPADLFTPLLQEASFDEVGVAASQLVSFLREEEDEKRWWANGGVVSASPGHLKIVGFPGSINELGELLREHLPDFLRGRAGEDARKAAAEATEGDSAGAAAEGLGDADIVGGVAREEPAPETPSTTAAPPTDTNVRLREISLRLDELSREVRRPGASPMEMALAAEEMSRLAAEQAVLIGAS